MAAVKGTVVDARTGKPVFNAHVLFTDAHGKPYSPLVGTVTDLSGKFSFENLGGYYLKVTHLGYADLVKPVDWKQFGAGGSYEDVVNFQLRPVNYSLPEVEVKGRKPGHPGWWEKNGQGITVLFGLAVFTYLLHKGGN